MRVIAVLLLSALIVTASPLFTALPKPGTYTVHITNLHDSCDDAGTAELTYTWRMKHLDDGREVVQGDFDWPYAMDGDLGAKVSVAQWSDSSGWQLNFYKIESKNYCEDLKAKLPEYFDEFISAFGKEPKCPLPKGKYKLQNWSTDLTKALPFPVLPLGRYRIDTSLYKTNQLIGCFRFEGEVRRKK